MKKSSKLVFFIILALIIVVALTAFLGIEGYYGDTRKVYIKGVNDVVWNVDTVGGADAVFTLKKGEKATEEDKAILSDVVTNRLNALGFDDKVASLYQKGNKLFVGFSWSESRTDRTVYEALSHISATGVVEVRKGSTYESELIFGNDGIANVSSPNVDQYTGGFSIDLTLTDEVTEIYQEATADLASAGENITLWIDGEKVVEQGVPGMDEDNTFSIISTVKPTTDKLLTSIASILYSGAIPEQFQMVDYKVYQPSNLDNILTAAKAALPVVAAICILYLLISFKLPGFIASIAMVGEFAVSVGILTGYFGIFPSTRLSISVLVATAFTLVLSTVFASALLTNIRKHSQDKKGVTSAISLGGKSALSFSLIVLSIIVVVAATVMIMFSGKENVSAFNVGLVVLMGSLFGFVINHLCLKSMLSSLSNFKAFDSPSIYGGSK